MKKFLIIFIILSVILGAAIIYLNQVIFPARIKSLIVSGLEEATQKKVGLVDLRFHIFKGLVLKNLTIYDAQETLLSIEEASCAFLLPSIFKKRIVIPYLVIKSPHLFLHRKRDATFNIQDLFLLKEDAASSSGRKKGFQVFIYKIKVSAATLHFQDDTLSSVFTKDIEDLDLILYLSLPASVKFAFKSRIQAPSRTEISARGQYLMVNKQLVGEASVKNLLLEEFQDYYRDLGITARGPVDEVAISIGLKDSVVEAKVWAKAKDLALSRDKISVKLNPQTTAVIKYNLINKKLEYAGTVALVNSDITGLDFLERISAINGQVQFNNAAVSADKLSANIWSIPVQAGLRLSDFKQPSLDVNIASTLDLGFAQGLLKDKLKIELPADIEGQGRLLLKIQTAFPFTGLPQINGTLEILNAAVHPAKINAPLEDIKGRLEFDLNGLRWSGVDFKYRDLPYKTSGKLTDFRAPQVAAGLTSAQLNLESILAIKQNLITISKLEGRYLNSAFAVSGNIDTAVASSLMADLSGRLNIDLQDIKKIRPRWEKIGPQGLMDVNFNLTGNLNSPKSCAVEAALSGPSLSIYGLKSEGYSTNYNQKEGIIDISPIHLSLYEGSVDADAKINLNSEEYPFRVSLDMQGIRIEKLKADTAAKDKDIAGKLSAQIKLNGFSGNLVRLSGAGQVNINEGKLWELSLFKGLGALLFVKDFDNIVFREGSCAFLIQDKYIFSDNLKLKSDITDLDGTLKIGFDGALEAGLNVHILDKNVPLAGTFKDITQAVIGQAGRFGVIKISGTLKDPKYKFQPAVMDIIKGIKDAFLGNTKNQ